MENRIVLGVVGAMHVSSGNQHLRDGIIVSTILVIADAHVVSKEIRQWGIQGVTAPVKCPSIEGLLKVKPVHLQGSSVLEGPLEFCVLPHTPWRCTHTSWSVFSHQSQHSLALDHANEERSCT